MKTNRGIYWAIMCTFMAIITIVCGLSLVESAKVAKLYLRHNITYTAPEYIDVTFDAGDGIFFDSQHTYDTTIKISTLSGTSIFPADPTRSGYTFEGWEYSVNNVDYVTLISSDDMPFTDHLYVRAVWQELPKFTFSLGDNVYTVTGLTEAGQAATELTIPSTYSGKSVTGIDSNAFDDVNPNLTSLTIPSSVTSIATTALQHVQYCDINWGEGWTAAGKASLLVDKKVAAGFWPQTYVGGTLNDELKNANLTDSDKTGKSYRMASGTSYSDCSYVILDEYEYNGARYVKGTKGSSSDYELHFSGEVYFSDKNTQSSPSNPVSGMADGTVFYFKVEPIVTTVKCAKNSNTQLVVLADKMLGTHAYNPTTLNWQGSPSLYTYLNVATQGTDLKDHSFYLDSGLSGSEWSTKLCNHGNTNPGYRRTKPVTGSYQINNNVSSSYSKDSSSYATYDPVWLPSYTEMGNGGIMGYTKSQSTSDANRKCEATDLAMATYASFSRDASNGVNAPSGLYCNWGSYFLRSAGDGDNRVCLVNGGGNVSIRTGPYNSSFGFRVAFAFNL